MKKFITILLILITGNLWSQEMLGPLKYNRHQEKDMKHRAERLRHIENKQRANSMELPFIDDFSTDKFPGNMDGEPEHWQDFYAFRNLTYAINPPSLGVVTFDGADEYGYPYNWNANNNAVPADTLTSVPINLDYPASDNVFFSFFYQGKGFGRAPEAADSLTLEFYSPNLDQWFHAWSVPGASMTEFEQVFVPITQSRYLRDGFQFRYVNYATPKGALDHWHIDYIQLDRNRAEGEEIVDVAYIYPAYTILENYSSMPWKHYVQNPTNFMADEVNLQAFNNSNDNRTIFDRTTEIYYEGDLQGEFVNDNEPPIFAQSGLDLPEPIYAGPFNYVFDTNVNDTAAVFDVYFSHVVTPDIMPSNNQLHLQQEFYSHYAYDDGTPEASYYAILTGSAVAIRYINFMADSLIGMAVWFEALNDIPLDGNNSYFPTVWSDGGSGPGNELVQGPWSGIPFNPGEEHGWRFIEFLEPVYLSSGGFYVGVQQTTTDRLHVGIDMNSNNNDENLYYYDPNFGSWYPSEIQVGTLMVRPVFQSDKLGPLSVENTALAEATIYPNPAVDQITLVTGDAAFYGSAEVMDLTGKVVQRFPVQGQTQMAVGDLSPGIYLMRIQSAQSDEQRVFKFVKQ